MSVKKCVICGKPFETGSNATMCSDECRAKRHKQYVSKQMKQHKRYAPEFRLTATNKKKSGLSIQEINKLAAKHRTTYGKMAAMLRDGKFPEGGKQ